MSKNIMIGLQKNEACARELADEKGKLKLSPSSMGYLQAFSSKVAVICRGAACIVTQFTKIALVDLSVGNFLQLKA